MVRIGCSCGIVVAEEDTDLPNNEMDLNKYKLDHSDRVAPGEGELPCTEMIKAVAAAGYDKGVSVELFNDEYYSMNPQDAVNRAYDSVKKLIGTLN